MEMKEYRYLFPFEKIPAGAKIIIYGAGVMGQAYLRQMQLTKYCDVVGMVDRNYKKYKNSPVPVYAPTEIHALSFDYVVIALRGASGMLDVRNHLKKEGVPEEKIVFIFERSLSVQSSQPGTATSDIPVEELAFSKKQPAFVFYITGGIGDFVFIKRFVAEIIRLVPDCLIDVYCAKQSEILRILYDDLKNINLIQDNLGTRYDAHKESYALALSISGMGYLQVDGFLPDQFQSFNTNFVSMIKNLQQKIEEENFSPTTPRSAITLRRIFNGQNCYSTYNYGVFQIFDKKVHIPLDDEQRKVFEELQLGDQYITLSCDSGASKDNSVISKSWPLKHFSRLVQLLKEKYPTLPIVQLGAAEAERIEGVDYYMLGKPFALAEHILANAAFHIDTEGGLVHLASQLGTKCIVLFGPTWEKYSGYEENINIKAGACHECYGVYPDANQCARGLKEPECMYSITPEMVMEQIERHLDNEASFKG